MFKYDKPTVNLCYTHGIGVILEYNSGVYYSNQTGGHSCWHPVYEGIYVPLKNELEVDQENELNKYFTGEKWEGWCDDKINIDTADFIDNILQSSPYTSMLKVDRNKLNENHEAWIMVEVIYDGPLGPDFGIFSDLKSKSGVLTWQNSD